MSIDPNNLQSTATLTWSDEFNNLSIWDGASGVWSTNWWYKDEWGLYNKSNGSTLENNGEQQWYINANYEPTAGVKPWAVSDGVLTITAAPADPVIRPLIDNYQYTSGMLNTWHSFSQQYGYFEISAQLPAGQGLWPAFWLLPQDGSWPPELDVFEVLGHEVDELHTSVHSNASGSHTLKTAHTQTGDLSQGFNRYGMDWQADEITFYFNGKEVAQFATPADMHKPMYLITNLAVGGHWPGAPNEATKFPAQMQIDYVRAYSENPNGPAGRPPEPSGPQTPGPQNPGPQAPHAAGKASISIAGSPAQAEGNSEPAQFWFTVNKAGDTSDASLVDFYVWSRNWGEVDSSDLRGVTTGTVYFQPGETQKAIAISVAGDQRAEGDEVFHVNLSNFRGADAGTTVATGTILNDDGWII